jgi:hypothetical protein
VKISALRARIDQEALAVRGVLRQPWQPTDFSSVRKFNPDEPRLPGGGPGGGRWGHGAGVASAVVDALKKAGGEDGDNVQFSGGRYIDWSSLIEDANHPDTEARQLEIGDGKDAALIDMSGHEQRSLFHALTLTVMADEGHPQSHHLAALSASGHEHIVFASGGSVDWSDKNPDGSRTIDATDEGGNNVAFDLSAEEFRQWQASLGLTELQDQQR